MPFQEKHISISFQLKPNVTFAELFMCSLVIFVFACILQGGTVMESREKSGKMKND